MAKTVKLSKPVKFHDKLLDEIELKEPSGGLYVKLGDPRVLVFNASGSAYWVERNETISEYLEACVAHEMGAHIINLLPLEDTMALKEELFGFFSDAAARRAAKKSTPSSSAPAP
ncbi:MAG TPA: hypothetical protein VKA12_04930 [Roseiarcus sp.]|nr:hypothetical protein [Roseiarcus sp.]